MRKYFIEFLKRGLMFAGFGPVIVGIVYYIISFSVDLELSGLDFLIAIISSYLLAFIQAGASVFNIIENWGITKSISFHLTTIYLAYLGAYLINGWIPFNWIVVLIFTLVFVIAYFIIMLVVYICTKSITKKLNSKLK